MSKASKTADVVLVGGSPGLQKTPTSIYLANRGIRTANVPAGAGPFRRRINWETLKKAAGRQSPCDAGNG